MNSNYYKKTTKISYKYQQIKALNGQINDYFENLIKDPNKHININDENYLKSLFLNLKKAKNELKELKNETK